MARKRKLATSSIDEGWFPVDYSLAMPAAVRARDDLEHEIVRSGYFKGAPFKCVCLIIREGSVDEAAPTIYDEIGRVHGELPLTIELNAERLLDVSAQQMEAIYRKVMLTALVYVGDQYGLRTEHFRGLLEAMEK